LSAPANKVSPLPNARASLWPHVAMLHHCSTPFWRTFIILMGLLVILALPAVAADSTYVVQRGDTLSGIARRYGISASQLAERNSLGRSHHVTIGQRLRIPGNAKTPVPATSSLPPAMADAINKAPVRAARWQYIVIHHSGVDEGTMKGMDRYHREVRGMENGLAYHFVIGNGNGMGDGEIAAGARWKSQLDGGHLRSESQNKIAIGICLVGNYDKHGPSAAQLRSLTNLTRALLERCKLPSKAVKTHQQINVVHTRCPGTKFPTRTFLNGLGR
jgi:hypothetical protein